MKLPEWNKNNRTLRIIAFALSITLILGILGTMLLLFGDFFDKSRGDDAEEAFVPSDVVNASLAPDVKFFDREKTAEIENSIQYANQYQDYLDMEIDSSSPLATLSVGDCFMLVGDEDSAFGSTYFGKVTSKYKRSNGTYVRVETPSIYELFDNMDMNILQKLDYSNMESYEALEGVQVHSLSAGRSTDSNNKRRLAPGFDGIVPNNIPNGVGITLELDLLKLLNDLSKGDKNKSAFTEVNKSQAKDLEVCYTRTGVCYHKSSCHFVTRNPSTSCSIYDAVVDLGLRPCNVCKPYSYNPENQDEDLVDVELKLKGSVTLTNMTIGFVGKNGKDWEFDQGFENLSVKTSGTLTADVKLEGNVSLKFEGEDTAFTIDGLFGKPFLTVEGLKEKLIPFLYCAWEGATFHITDVPDNDDKFSAPLSIGILFYTDLYGNISVGCEVNCTYTKQITNEIDIYKDGKFLGIGAEKDVVNENISESDNSSDFSWSMKAEASGEVTFEALGASVMLYLGNINVLELKVATLVLDASGSYGYDSAKKDEEDGGFFKEGDARLHLKMFDLKMKAKVKGAIMSLEANCTLGPLRDFTLWRLNKLTNRDIVLVLDTSGSMYGQAIEAAKASAIEFINTVLEQNSDVSIGIVTYNSSYNIICPLTNHKEMLLYAVKNIYDGGNTNIESGLYCANKMLQERNAKKQSIVLLSDGMPNTGKVGQGLIDYANTIKSRGVYMYTLGFFHGLSNESKAEAQSLMEKIASNGLHYEVTCAEDLVFFFGDLADQVSGQNYIYIRIACPVDVVVSYNGEILSSKWDSENTRTSFGTLTFEENDSESGVGTDTRIKILRLKEGAEYDIRINGNGTGRMNYTIGFVNEDGEYADLREFKNIEISETTQIQTTAKVESKTYLYVDKDGDGRKDITYKAGANEEAVVVKNSRKSKNNTTTIVVVSVISTAVVAGGAAGVFVYLKKRKEATGA